MNTATAEQSGPDTSDTMRGEWSRYFSFIKRPVLPEKIAPAAPSFKALGRMLALDMVIMAVLIAAAAAAVSLGFEIPSNAFEDLEFTPLIIFFIIIFAPLLEELGFRSWLSGKIGHVLSWAICVAAIIAIASLSAGASTSLAASIAILVIGFAAIIAAALCLFFLRGRAPMRWFSRIFPAMFWLSTAAFAAMHFLNYNEGALPVLIILVIPQFILGSIAAYVRVNYGLWAGILLHALHNSSILAITLASAAAFPDEEPKQTLEPAQATIGQIFTAVPLAETIT